MKKIIMLALGGVLLAGCSAKYNTASVTKSTELLVKNKTVVVALPENGVYETRVYSGSGAATAQVIQSAFSRYTDSVFTIPGCAELECLKKKRSLSEGYYVVPQILHWEDRATEWSGIPDRIEVKITIYNSATDSVIASSILSGKSKWATFGGDHPQDLLPEPINNYVAGLY
ncbi:DUF4823 domain-containing protein [Klebsiella sp. RHBSTW-00484]|uniref:DUF4823 domain-containing protein n=1 Tax=unclassified Klebsiella TaxID=2608929 RepID=UPI0015E4FE9D|nr:MULTISPECIES: DUF4823 domain-containing protein [unclassified Klebsiella]MBA7847666.1 DUF4823 domain-containing protein [Klebsiella sp. RHBSTW-00465]QLO36463.1 DUF4823 domain-containing protein [Klebsiella sp. RHBSTW-00484]QLT75981.1 DUF4823 domain-containing protein [Klebsiella sp. RHBSTW-00464]